MKLPNSQRAYVAQEKITDYLLSTIHPQGRSKARFFLGFGFHIDRWQELAGALKIHGASHEIVGIVENDHGTRYSLDGVLETPDRRNPLVKTIWIVDRGSVIPRFVTAYPVRR